MASFTYIRCGECRCSVSLSPRSINTAHIPREGRGRQRSSTPTRTRSINTAHIPREGRGECFCSVSLSPRPKRSSNVTVRMQAIVESCIKKIRVGAVAFLHKPFADVLALSAAATAVQGQNLPPYGSTAGAHAARTGSVDVTRRGRAPDPPHPTPKPPVPRRRHSSPCLS